MKIKPASDDFLTTAEIAKYLHLNEKKIYVLASEGKLPAVRISGKWLFPRDLVEAYLRENATVPAEGLLKRLLSQMFVIAGSDDILFREVVYDAAKVAGYPVALSVVGTHVGVAMLSRNQVHAATVHFPVAGSAHGIPRGAAYLMVALYKRQQGLICRKGSGVVRTIEDLVARKQRFAAREEGCSTRTLAEDLFEKAGRTLAGYRRVAGPYLTHREAARAVASGEADAALGIKQAAADFGLAFNRIVDEEFGLLMPASYMAEPKILGFVDALVKCIHRAPAPLTDGYDVAPAGKISAFSGPAGSKAVPA